MSPSNATNVRWSMNPAHVTFGFCPFPRFEFVGGRVATTESRHTRFSAPDKRVFDNETIHQTFDSARQRCTWIVKSILFRGGPKAPRISARNSIQISKQESFASGMCVNIRSANSWSRELRPAAAVQNVFLRFEVINLYYLPLENWKKCKESRPIRGETEYWWMVSVRGLQAVFCRLTPKKSTRVFENTAYIGFRFCFQVEGSWPSVGIRSDRSVQTERILF